MVKFALLLTVIAIIVAGLIQLDGVFEASTSLRCTYCETISVTSVIDGETFVTGGTTVRLYGVSTPEEGLPCADLAAERLKDLAGDAVRISQGSRTTDPFGRSLAYVYTEAGESIDELLVKEGLAVARTVDGQYKDHFMKLEEEVKSERVGCLWKSGRY